VVESCVSGVGVDVNTASVKLLQYVAGVGPGLADAIVRDVRGGIVIHHGVSGSGKTWASQVVLETAGAIRIRSDVERKRMHGLATGARSGARVEAGIYSINATAAVYEHARAGHDKVVEHAHIDRHGVNQIALAHDASRLAVPHLQAWHGGRKGRERRRPRDGFGLPGVAQAGDLCRLWQALHDENIAAIIDLRLFVFAVFGIIARHETADSHANLEHR
jgi:hypothetical protein